ncbi:hypothetical protein ACN0TX_11990 [Staphylococcus cohnii]|uniref:hypothetical protein n=1 Tax=Staphylococcus cohnii TaxID=29382 RepID=UPI003AF75D50
MKANKKLKSTIVTTWTISTLLLLISLVIYILLVGIFKFDYFAFILPFSKVIILPIVVIFLNIIFVLNYEMETSSFKNFIPTFGNKKIFLIPILILSLFICLITIVAQYKNITTTIFESNNVDSMHGTVENIYGFSSKIDGSVEKVVVIKDSNGKEHKMIPSKKLESLDLNNEDKITVDYFKPKYSSNIDDGTILKYESQK